MTCIAFCHSEADSDIANFAYSFDDNGNIQDQTFDHRTSSPYNEYTYDNLDRMVRADYLSDPCDNEQFTLDDLGSNIPTKCILWCFLKS